MSTLSTLSTSDTPADTLITKFNDNFTALNTDKAEKSGGTFTGDIVVPDEAYGAGWDGSLEVPTKNAIYDKIQAMPALSDGDKGDIVVSGSGATWTVDNDVISFAKMQNMTGDRILGRVSGVSGDIGELTGTQVNTLLPDATASLGGRMSSADKTKLDSLSNEWTALTNSTYTAGGTYDSGTLTSYDLYKIVISGTSTGASTFIGMRVNSDATPSSYTYYLHNAGSTSISSGTDWYFPILSHNNGSGYPFYTELVMTSATCNITNTSGVMGSTSGQIIAWGNKTIAVTSIQLSLIQTISGKIQIFGKNF